MKPKGERANELTTRSSRSVVLNAGCGPLGSSRLPTLFDDWQQTRVDVDSGVQPDIVANITDLSMIPNGSVGAIWSAHCMEHLYLHEVGKAFAEFHRVLSGTGFICVIVPDLQTVAKIVASDKLHEVIYKSDAGPVTAHDILYGFGPALAQGHLSMAHRSGFTPTLLMRCLTAVPFEEIVLRRRPNLELAAVGRKSRSANAGERDALLAALEL